MHNAYFLIYYSRHLRDYGCLWRGAFSSAPARSDWLSGCERLVMRTHILIVENDLDISKILTLLFTDRGYQTTTLADYRRVGDFLADSPVHLLLLDDADPGSDG